jgi:hypothetical protein
MVMQPWSPGGFGSESAERVAGGKVALQTEGFVDRSVDGEKALG